MWSMDETRTQTLPERGSRWEDTPAWQPETLPGKRGFDTAHRLLKSHVRSIVADFTTVDLRELGTFDLVLYLGVLYHMRDPLLSLERLRQVTKKLAILETAAVTVPGQSHEPLWRFYSHGELNADITNWWAPNAAGLVTMAQRCGFSVEIVQGEQWRPAKTRLWEVWDHLRSASGWRVPQRQTIPYRLIAHLR